MENNNLVEEIYKEFELNYIEDAEVNKCEEILLKKIPADMEFDFKIYLKTLKYFQISKENELVRFVLNYISNKLKVEKKKNNRIFFD